MAEKSTTVISLPQMVDLALNSPEVGIVNFTVLHSLLHVIVNQLDLGECNVEFRGSDSERLQNYIATARPGPIITLTEYTIGADGKGRKKRRGSKKGKRGSVDEKGKRDENQKEKEIAILKKEEEQGSTESSGSFQTIVVVEPASKEKIGESPKFTIALTKEQLSKLQKDIKDLQRQVRELTEMPANIGLIDALRSSRDGSTPLLDMFQILTLVKRMDAAEVAMNKIATMLEDLAREHTNLAAQQSSLAAGSSEEDTPSEDSNQIIDEGESVGSSSDAEFSDDDYEEDDSFICDEKYVELLLGDEYDLDNEKKKKKPRKSRIIDPAVLGDGDIIIVPRKKNVEKKEQKKRSRIISVSDSSGEEQEPLSPSPSSFSLERNEQEKEETIDLQDGKQEEAGTSTSLDEDGDLREVLDKKNLKRKLSKGLDDLQGEVNECKRRRTHTTDKMKKGVIKKDKKSTSSKIKKRDKLQRIAVEHLKSTISSFGIMNQLVTTTKVTNLKPSTSN